VAGRRVEPLNFDAAAFDKVNALVRNKGTGKSHTAKLVLEALRALGTPCSLLGLSITSRGGRRARRAGNRWGVRNPTRTGP
jgi:hypothetical protein